jgi:hypothetical protein
MASRCFRGRLLAPAIVVGLGFSAVAAAEPSPVDRRTARALMAEGRADRDNGDLQGALRAFTGADAIMRVPTTGLEVARTEATLGLLVEAWEDALRVSRFVERPGEPTPFKVARDAAAVMKSELEGRIPSLMVTVTNVPRGTTAAVTIDDVVIPPEALGLPRKLDPGRHVVVAQAGGVERTQEVDLPERDRKETTLDLSDWSAAPTTPQGAASARDAPPEGAPPRSHDRAEPTAWTVAGFGFAGAGLGVGAVTGALSLSKTGAIKRSTDCVGTVCGPGEYGDIRTARSLATLSTVSFIVAGAGAVTGVLALVKGHSPSLLGTTRDKPAQGEGSLRIEPWLGVASIGLRGTF